MWRASVAVKRLRPGSDGIAARRLREEAAALARARHPNVVRLVDVVPDGDRDGDRVALVLEHAEGGTLAALARARGGLRSGEVVALLAPIADALAAAHARGVVHGDVSPSNVLLDRAGTPLLADFAGPASRGTPGYTAPEVEAGAPPTAAADVFALAAVATAIVRDPTAGLTAALAAALDADPNRRPTATRLRAALLAAVPAAEVVLPGPAEVMPSPGIDDEPVTRPFAGGPGPAPAGPDVARRHRSRAVALLATAVLVLAAVAAIRVIRADGDGCPATAAPAADAIVGDPDGDGCDTVGSYDGEVLEIVVEAGDAAPRRYAVGRAGDVLVLGDWDCDGRDTPGLYRPSTGAIVYYDAWGGPATPAAPSAYGGGPTNGTAAVARGTGDSCDELVVSPSPRGG